MATIETPEDPSGRLISAATVVGASVFNLSGEKLGTVGALLIDKENGRVAQVVLSFGGFLGIGDKSHPLPWEMLRYDPALGGYVVDLDKDTLEGAPAYADNAGPLLGGLA